VAGPGRGWGPWRYWRSGAGQNGLALAEGVGSEGEGGYAKPQNL
jgi:hypothetical protein